MASSPVTSWQIEKKWKHCQAGLIFLGSKITVNGDCSNQIKRCLLLGRITMTNLDSILNSRAITLLTKFHIVEAMDIPGGSDGKAFAYHAGDPSLIPGSERSPGEGNGNSHQYCCLDNPMDGGVW